MQNGVYLSVALFSLYRIWVVPYGKISTTQLQLCDLIVVLDNEVKTLNFVTKCFQFLERGIKYYLKRSLEVKLR